MRLALALAWLVVAGVGLSACPAPRVAVQRIAYFERVDAPLTPDVSYYPLKLAARAGTLAVLDTSANLGFKSSRILRLDAATGKLLTATSVPRGTQRGAKAAAVAMDAQGRIYVAIEGRRQTHLVRLTRPAPLPPPKVQPAVSPAPSPPVAAKEAITPPAPARREATRLRMRALEALRPPVAGDPTAGVARGIIGGTGTSGGISARVRAVGRPERQEWDALRGGKYPAGLAVDAAGENLVLVDGGNHRLIRMAWKGTDPVVIGSTRELELPRGVAWAADGEIITKKNAKGSVLTRYRPDGALLGEVEVKGLTEDLKWFYNELLIGPDDKLYMTDYQKSCVRVLSRDGAHQSELRDPLFKGPMGLAFDEQNNLWVADAWGKRILKFRPVYEKEAAARVKLGRPGPRPAPESPAIDAKDSAAPGPAQPDKTDQVTPAAREGG